MSAAKNPKAPKELLTLLYRAGASEDLRSFEKITKHISLEDLKELSTLGPFGRALWMRHPKTPLEKIAYSLKDFLC